MAKSNRERVGEILDALRAGLGPYVLREYSMTYGRGKFLDEVTSVLRSGAYDAQQFTDAREAVAHIDVQGWLNLMHRRWREVFSSKLSNAHRGYVSLLMEVRNDWAHQQPFSNDKAYRAADQATELLRAINAAEQAEATQRLAQELLRLRYEADQKRAQKTTSSMDQAPTAQKGLRPWRMVVKPHPDVASGRYVQAEFAADLAQVVKGEADPEYGDPQEFFRRTYLTEGLASLLVTGIKRLNGMGGDPVVQLQTSFGGGKTHSMLALYHLCGGSVGLSEITGGETLLQDLGEVDDRVEANRAVIVGTAFSATQPRVYPDATTHTLAGDIAYQLGGAAAYRLVEQDDVAGISPGSDTLKQLFEEHGPSLIIIDELVAFARQLYQATDRLAAGTFDAVMTFVQSLTEAVRRSSDSILLVSIPESDYEIGGEGGKATVEILAKTIGRIESVWKPVTATESFEIVRRRLFASEIDYAARDAVLTAYRDMYRNDSGNFPSGVAEGEYYQRMQSAYPIHPELFDRLYQDWSTLERFQRTRGVLRLMASVIHELWLNNDPSVMIMPGSMPLHIAKVRDEMLRYLPEGWSAVSDKDIDGTESQPFKIDKGVPTLGQFVASRRVARTIFVGSAPTVAEQAVRGLEEVRINLGTVQPGEPVAVFGDALRRMSNQLTYLYTDGSRYWYDTRPTVNRLAQDRAQGIHEDVVFEEAVRRLRKVSFNRRDFAGVHLAPTGSSEVPDEQRTRLVVIDPVNTHKKGQDASAALMVAKEILNKRGDGDRYHRNMLLFLAADAVNAEAFEQAVRDYLAWKSIQDEQDELNLDAQQRKQVKTSLGRSEETLTVRLQETYNWLLVPVQPQPTGQVQWQVHRISGQDGFYERAARKLRQSEWLVYEWGPRNLSMELERFLWGDQPHLSIATLWEYLSNYCYLPRLYNVNVLLNAIAAGVAMDRVDAPFGYAASLRPDDSYEDAVIGAVVPIAIDGFIVKADFVPGKKLPIDPPPIVDPPPLPPKPKNRRYHGSKVLDAQRVNKQVGDIVEEVLEHLVNAADAGVEVRIEITARSKNGFDDRTVGTVSENSNTLNIQGRFEDE